VTPILQSSDPTAARKALEIFQAGGLVAIPTETVYGLAADATNAAAVARIYEANGRPSFNPLIAHCSTLDMARRYGVFSDMALMLARQFWPGPLTIVVPYADGTGLADLVRAGLNTIALRMPVGPGRTIIGALDRPIAAPSANLSGRLSPTRAIHVKNQLDGLIDLIIDDDACAIGVESTIVSCAASVPVLLRPGGVEVGALEAVIGGPLERASGESPIAAPGMLASHYAPLAGVRLNARALEGEDGALNFGPSNLEAQYSLSLSERGDLREAAARLFACLAAFDERGVRSIAVAQIPEVGLGLAINDRLRRAAAPRQAQSKPGPRTL